MLAFLGAVDVNDYPNNKTSVIAFTLQAGPQAAFSWTIPYGPVNRKALALLDKQRLAVLPSSEDNLPKGVLQNFDWWAQNGQKAGERFNSWILS